MYMALMLIASLELNFKPQCIVQLNYILQSSGIGFLWIVAWKVAKTPLIFTNHYELLHQPAALAATEAAITFVLWHTAA